MDRQIANIRDSLQLLVRQHGEGRLGANELRTFTSYVEVQLGLLKRAQPGDVVSLRVMTAAELVEQGRSRAPREFTVHQGGKSA